MTMAFPNHSRFSSFRGKVSQIYENKLKPNGYGGYQSTICERDQSEYDPYSLSHKEKKSQKLLNTRNLKGRGEMRDSPNLHEDCQQQKKEQETYSKFLHDRIEELKLVINESPQKNERTINSEKKVISKKKINIVKNANTEEIRNEEEEQKKRSAPFKLEKEGSQWKPLGKLKTRKSNQSETFIQREMNLG